MFVEFPFPCVIRAKPPRCTSVRQVVALLPLLRNVPVRADSNFPLAAVLDHGEGQREEVRHDGTDFYRRICPISDISGTFQEFMQTQGYVKDMYLTLMYDERRNNLEYSTLTWPTKENRRPRRLENFDNVLEFEDLNGNDVLRCRSEAERLLDYIVAYEDGVWIRCEEPCYRIGRSNSNNFRVQVDVTFADQDRNPRPDETFMSAIDRDAVLEEATRLAGGHPVGSGKVPDISVLNNSLFDIDFADRGFVKFAGFVVENIAAYLAQDGVYPVGTALLEADPADVALWAELRKSVKRMQEAGTAREGNDDLVMRGAELWKRYGGCASRPAHLSAATVDQWLEMPIRNWLDRPVTVWTHTDGDYRP